VEEVVGSLGVRELNTALQRVLNPVRSGEPTVERLGWRFQMGDKVIQTENDYDKDVFNGDVGIIERIDAVEQQVAPRFAERLVKYDFGDLDEISLAYAITIPKSQGSEFPAVVIPLATQHYMLLQRNLIYTGITRGERLLVLIGQKKALGIAVRNDRPQRRHSGLLAGLKVPSIDHVPINKKIAVAPFPARPPRKNSSRRCWSRRREGGSEVTLSKDVRLAGRIRA
jgi:exodeoxyribonuclease V alpha subunit